MKDKPHADLFDRVVVALVAERVQSAVSELGDAVVKDRKQLDIQPGNPLVLKVVPQNWAVPDDPIVGHAGLGI